VERILNDWVPKWAVSILRGWSLFYFCIMKCVAWSQPWRERNGGLNRHFGVCESYTYIPWNRRCTRRVSNGKCCAFFATFRMMIHSTWWYLWTSVLIFLEKVPAFLRSFLELCHMWRQLGTYYFVLIINMGLVASCWFISLHRTFHDARSQEPKTHIYLIYDDH